MAEKKYYWLKLQNDFFSSLRIKKLRKLAGGDTFTIIYLKMQLVSLKSDGVLEYKGIESSFAEEMALELDEDIANVQVTIQYLLSCGLLVESDNQYEMPYVKENTQSETKWAEKKRIQRAKKDEVRTIEGHCPIEIDIEKDKEIDKDKDKYYSDDFESLWKLYPRKVDKSRAYKCYCARLKKKNTHEDLLKAVQNYIRECEKNKTETKYIKHLSTFFSADEPFKDYLESEVTDGTDKGNSSNGNEYDSEMLKTYGL